MKSRIQLGLCCMNLTLREQKPSIFASRKMTIQSIIKHGINTLQEKIIQNLQDVLKMIEWNEKNGIKVFRLSSELFPHKTNPKVENYNYDFAIPLLREIGEKAKYYNHRITFHPGQYNVVGSPYTDKFEQTINDLSYHADVLNYMGMGPNSVMVVHGGGIYGNKEKTKERWCKQFYMLPKKVQDRLVLENCEKCFSIQDCLDISEKINIPVVFDTHHYECYKLLHKDEIETIKEAEYYIPKILETWKKRNIKPKFHISEQGSGRIGHHSDYIKSIPKYLLEIPDKYDIDIDIMIEAKKKELAILDLYKKYPELCIKQENEIKENEIKENEIKENEIKKKKKKKNIKLKIIDNMNEIENKEIKLTNKQKLIDNIFQPNNNGISRWVSREELTNTQIQLSNNGNSRHGIFFGDKRYIWEKQTVNNRVISLRTNGYSDDILYGHQRPIRNDIKKFHLQTGCVVCGSKSDLKVDHKNDLYNDIRVLNIETQTIDDFQCLCNHCNLQKRQVIKYTKKTGKRYKGTNIEQLKIFGVDFISGDEEFNPNNINALVGTYWYDPIAFMKYIKETIVNSK